MKTPNNIAILKNVEDVEKRDEANYNELEQEDVTILSEGDDQIEIEMNEADKIVYGSSFSPEDGDLGDESEDTGDLPEEMKHNRYNSKLSVGEEEEDKFHLEENMMHITDAEHAGIAYDDNDYTEGRI